MADPKPKTSPKPVVDPKKGQQHITMQQLATAVLRKFQKNGGR
jgi:hypothetical protein